MQNAPRQLIWGSKHQEGQMLLIVVLVMVVVLTVGLSVATRSITNLRSTTEEENSQRAFSAAEAGVELALTTGSATNSATYNADVKTLGESLSFAINNGEIIDKDEGADIWLSDYPTYANQWSGSFTIDWGTSSDICDPDETVNTMAALEIIVLSGSTTSPTVSHYAVDPCSQRASSNSFTAAGSGGTVDGVTYTHSTTVTVASTSKGLIARVIPVYAPTMIAINSTTDLPAQGKTITSTGTSDTSERKLTLFEGYPRVPTELFPFVVFSPK